MVIETIGIVVMLAEAAGLLVAATKLGRKTIKTLNRLIRKTDDPFLKKLFIQKRDLEVKETAITEEAKNVIVQLEKHVKKKKGTEAELQATEQTAALLKTLGDKIGQLKTLKKVKLNVQKKIYANSKKLGAVKKDTVSIHTIAKEILDLELQLESEEAKEAQVEDILSKAILRLESMGTEEPKKLAQLLNDFIALAKLSRIERHVDEFIHEFIETHLDKARAV